MASNVQCFFLKSNKDVPNSPFPMLLYKGVLPQHADESLATHFLTKHKWEKRGTWGHIGIRHFHPNSHECYGIFQGHSKLLIGKIEDGTGAEVAVEAGDVIVLPAGTAHSCLESSPDYKYIGVYPKDCPKWRNEMGKQEASTFRTVIKQVAMPEADPVYGDHGPLMRLWHTKTLSKL